MKSWCGLKPYQTEEERKSKATCDTIAKVKQVLQCNEKDITYDLHVTFDPFINCHEFTSLFKNLKDIKKFFLKLDSAYIGVFYKTWNVLLNTITKRQTVLFKYEDSRQEITPVYHQVLIQWTLQGRENTSSFDVHHSTDQRFLLKT